jgi:transposase-like protein
MNKSNWLRRYSKKSNLDLVMQQQSEISRLKKELAQARMELKILKKAIESTIEWGFNGTLKH